MSVCRSVGLGILFALSASVAFAADTDRLLVEAAKAQNRQTVRMLLAKGVDVNVTLADGSTALHWAAHWGDGETADLLIDAGARVNAANDNGVTPLALACLNGAPPMVTRLLAAGADPNLGRHTGETPLMTAARTGAVPVVEALLARGADVQATELAERQTALMWAVAERHADVSRLLMHHGADVWARAKSGFTPLLFAARVGDLESAQALVDAGADVNDTAPDGSSVLVVATVRGHADLARLLLDYGADPNASGSGFTALHWAAGSWETEMTGPNGIVVEDDDEWSALAGVRRGKLDLVRALLEHGADANAPLKKTPPRVGYTQLQVEQRVAGVNPYPGATPFLLAAMAADIDLMRLLAGAGADTSRTANDKTTPLMVAAGLGRYMAESRVPEARALEAIRVVLEYGGDINAVNEAGNTALHGAAQIKADSIVQLLVEHGAALDITNVRGQTPVMVADTIRAGSATVSGRTATGDLLRRLDRAGADGTR